MSSLESSPNIVLMGWLVQSLHWNSPRAIAEIYHLQTFKCNCNVSGPHDNMIHSHSLTAETASPSKSVRGILTISLTLDPFFHGLIVDHEKASTFRNDQSCLGSDFHNVIRWEPFGDLLTCYLPVCGGCAVSAMPSQLQVIFK